jgi:hypothetical protein
LIRLTDPPYGAFLVWIVGVAAVVLIVAGIKHGAQTIILWRRAAACRAEEWNVREAQNNKMGERKQKENY